MRVTICRGQTSLVRVQNGKRVGYFNAGRYLTDQRIEKLAQATHINLRNKPEV